MPNSYRAKVPLKALLRINLTYFFRHGRLPKLATPDKFTELVQRRKLRDRNPLYPVLADKLMVKKIVADQIGDEWITPTLWSGTRLPEKPLWPYPFVVKARHGCNQIAFVTSPDDDWPKIKSTAEAWLGKVYGRWLDEWVYKHIPHGILVEPFIGQSNVVPVDYKFYVFNGEVAFIQVHLDREHNHRWILFDRHWRRVSAATDDGDPTPPGSLKSMIAAAEKLGDNIDFVRVDLYEANGLPVFGELTFYPGSGLDPFNPVSLDKIIGEQWLKAADELTGKRPLVQFAPPTACPEQNMAATT
ncbi:ATP-grasp fold amidoligase family protein [Parasphingorhabdus sp.]|uniref:ATP-grasp fold amidoligase family protein n=1 Tax=Parasphingorhabdus sp. TaxID=2709688 RepID=UPI003A8EC1E9